MELQFFLTGDKIFREGDVGNALYLLIEGRVKMTREVNVGRGRVKSKVLVTFGSHSERPWFGELALWESRATRPCPRSRSPLLCSSLRISSSPFPTRSRSRAPPPPCVSTR